MIDHTLFCAGTDESRPNLNGVLCTRWEPDTFAMVASDGHRLALIERSVPGLPATLASLVLPVNGMAEARTLCRSCLENMFWISGLVRQRQEFLKKIELPRARGVTLTQDGSNFIVSYGPTTDVVEISPNTLTPVRESVLTQSYLSGSHVFNWTRMTGRLLPAAS